MLEDASYEILNVEKSDRLNKNFAQVEGMYNKLHNNYTEVTGIPLYVRTYKRNTVSVYQMRIKMIAD